jgi:hypothetical protein
MATGTVKSFSDAKGHGFITPVRIRVRKRTAHARARAGWWRSSRRSFLTGASVGAALATLFDPKHGRRRRHFVCERSMGAVRHGRRRLARAGRASAVQTLGHARGALHRLRPPKAEPLDDVGLAHKVESILYRDPHVPKGQISINTERGVVFLRGQLESSELIGDVADAVRKIPGVTELVNLLHLPGTEAPHPPPKLSRAW